jgi:Zn-dependent peptidase ImmA (M78 family)
MEQQLLIPKSFTIGGHHYKVKIVKKVNKDGDYGLITRENKTIRLKKPDREYIWEMMEETFYHELVHAILDETENATLSNNEKFVGRLSKALYQAIKTFKY